MLHRKYEYCSLWTKKKISTTYNAYIEGFEKEKSWLVIDRCLTSVGHNNDQGKVCD